MSSEVQLTDEQIQDAWAGASDPDCAEMSIFGFARAIEQAVRAQWAAEMSKVYELLHRTEDEKMALRAERDSAQAEAKALKEALKSYGEELAKAIEGNHIISGGNGPNFNAGWEMANSCAADLVRLRTGQTIEERAALQPGASHDE